MIFPKPRQPQNGKKRRTTGIISIKGRKECLVCFPEVITVGVETLNFDLNEDVIDENERIIRERAPRLVGDRLREVVVFGSCARGDYGADSDMDVAVIIDDTREAMNKYVYLLVGLSTDIALENFSVVNFLCIPADDYTKMRDYALYHNVLTEGKKIFG